jgi:hypothetical protein
MQSLYRFPEIITTDMSLRNEDRKWVDGQIEDAVKALKPHGWTKLFFWLREWGILGACVSIVFAMLAITLGALYQSFSHVKEETEFRTNTKDRLTSIESKLDKLEAKLIRSALDDLIHLDDKSFAKALPALHEVTEQPVSQVNPSPALLQQVAQKLRNTPEDAADYWPTILKFISFASAGLSSDVPPPGSKINMSLNRAGNITIIQSHAVILLDGGGLINSRIDHSRIIFTENPVKLQNVIFTDCAFEMPVTAKPSPFLQQASKVLLASDFKSAQFLNL